jgi:hypothetical protein
MNKSDKVDESDTGKIELIKLEFFMDPDIPAWDSKYSQHFSIFKDGCPEVWIKCLRCGCPSLRLRA